MKLTAKNGLKSPNLQCSRVMGASGSELPSAYCTSLWGQCYDLGLLQLVRSRYIHKGDSSHSSGCCKCDEIDCVSGLECDDQRFFLTITCVFLLNTSYIE